MLQILGLSREVSSPAPVPVSAPITTANDQDPAQVVPVNKAETSNRTVADLQPVVPRLFVQSNYVAAVRASDGAILSRGVPAQPAEVIELYGTGFGPTKIAGPNEADSMNPKSTDIEVTVSIGGVRADVRFVGRVGPGLYQINVVVPGELHGGHHPVIVSVLGIGPRCEGFLNIAKPTEVSTRTDGRYSGFMRKVMGEKTDSSSQERLV